MTINRQPQVHRPWMPRARLVSLIQLDLPQPGGRQALPQHLLAIFKLYDPSLFLFGSHR